MSLKDSWDHNQDITSQIVLILMSSSVLALELSNTYPSLGVRFEDGRTVLPTRVLYVVLDYIFHMWLLQLEHALTTLLLLSRTLVCPTGND